MTKIKVPFRLDIAGSFTDLSVYRAKGGAHVTLPLDYYIQISQGSGCLQSDFINEINSAVSRLLNVAKLDLCITCDLHHGAGLGASSATIVGIIKFYLKHYSRDFPPDMVARIAIALIEANKSAGGRQDEYSAAFGLPLYLEYDQEVLDWHIVELPNDFRTEIEQWGLIYRERNISCQDMLKHEIAMNYPTEKIVKLTTEIYRAIENDAFERFWSLYRHHWHLVEELNPLKINDDIRELRCQFPKTFIRPCGAGAGGYILIHDKVPLAEEIIKVKLKI